jgi:type I restriction-modification system specificity subunit S
MGAYAVDFIAPCFQNTSLNSLRPLFTLCSVYAGDSIPAEQLEDDKPIPVYGSNGIRGYADLANNAEDQVLIGRQGSVGTVCFAHAPFWAAEHALLVKPFNENTNKRWLMYVIEALELARLSRAVAQPGINSSSVLIQRVPNTAPPTQKRIADYLDHETAEIDAAVADLDRYVELLRLRSRALIKKQFDTDCTCVKMSLLAEAIIGITYTPDDVVTDGGICVYRSGNVQNSHISREDMVHVDVKVPSRFRFKEGDILMCSRNGSANLVGKNAIVEREDIGSTWGAFMTVIRSDLNPYLFWYFRSPQFDEHRGLFSTSTINQLTTGILHRIPVPLPPKQRRDEIIRTLSRETAKIDALIADATKLRDLLLKRRAVLINDVVTGKKQV